jgi:predicted RNA-binding Zn ribbon-like protein
VLTTTLPASVDVDDDDEKTNRRERAVRKRIRVCANHGCGACFVDGANERTSWKT